MELVNMLQSAAIVRNRRRKPVSEAVAGRLAESGLGYNEIERRTGGRINHSYLSKLVSGASANPRLDKLIELADVFGVTVSELIGDEDVEPGGFRQSLFWDLFESYEALDKPLHRKMVEDHLR